MKRKTLFKLTKKQMEMFEANRACLKACERIVEKVVHQWEEAELARDVMWRKMYEQAKPILKEMGEPIEESLSKLGVRHDTNEVYLITGDIDPYKEKIDLMRKLDKQWRDDEECKDT